MNRSKIPHFLSDTWWYGLTKRLHTKKFEELAQLRKKQGFSAIQLVFGIPPEIGVYNPNASGRNGSAWNLSGEFNKDYLNFAKERVKLLNSLGFLVIIFGAWGYQIEWLGKDTMVKWWEEIIRKTRNLNVLYCLTGESNLWIGEERKLLPDKTTDDLNPIPHHSFLKGFTKKVKDIIIDYKKKERIKKWSYVLGKVSSLTDKPFLIHTLPTENSEEVVNNSYLLDAITIQTGHDLTSRKSLWKLPLEFLSIANKPFINLEPWYEGIKDQFGIEDQLYAYWTSIMAGAHAYCYGAQGVWNVGDGVFLAHWGKQKLNESIKFKSPELIGKSYKFCFKIGIFDYEKIEIDDRREVLIINRINRQKVIRYISNVAFVRAPEGRMFLPLEGRISSTMPDKGPVVFF